MTPEGYLRDLARTLSGPAPAEPSLPVEWSDAEPSRADLPQVQQALEGRDIDEVFPHLSSLSASFHGRALRETVEKLGLRADARGCPSRRSTSWPWRCPSGAGWPWPFHRAS